MWEYDQLELQSPRRIQHGSDFGIRNSFVEPSDVIHDVNPADRVHVINEAAAERHRLPVSQKRNE